MYITMNRFKIRLGSEQEFIDIWKNNDTYLNGTPDFRAFNLLQGHLTMNIPCLLPIHNKTLVKHFKIGFNRKHSKKLMLMLAATKRSI